jgi:predicted DCC family thiol-disulfide oxidoreductase YuxK
MKLPSDQRLNEPTAETSTPAGGPVKRADRPYSYRADPAVPQFDDSGPLVLVDGECALCSHTAELICRLDRKAQYRIAPAQSRLGRALLAHYGFDAGDPATWLYIVDGCAYAEFAAAARVGLRLGGWGLLATPLGWPPARVRAWLYDFVAKRRIRWFGRADLCSLPNPELRRRLLL